MPSLRTGDSFVLRTMQKLLDRTHHLWQPGNVSQQPHCMEALWKLSTPKCLGPPLSGRSGRVIIPAELRRERGWESGTPLVVCRDEDGGIHIKSRDEFIEDVQSYFVEKFGKDRCISEELLEERRQEVARESSRD